MIDSMILADDPLYVQVMMPEVHVVMLLMGLMKNVLRVGEGSEEAVDVMTCEKVDEDDVDGECEEDVDVDECDDVGNVVLVGRETGPAHRAPVK